MSSSETLSQSEVDRMPSGDATIEVAQPYDFRRPHRVSKERLRTLETMYERMVKSLEGWVIGRIRGQIEMRLQSVEQFSFGEFTSSLPTPCASFVFDVTDSGGQQGIIDIGQEFAFYLVDRLFGGNGRQPAATRPLTRVERMAIRGLVERATALLCDVWADHIPMSLDISAFESLPDILLQTANREDPVLVAKIEVVAGDVSSSILVCLPFAVLDKFFTNGGKRRVNTATGSEHERAVNREIAEQSLRVTRVNVSARLPEFRMTMRDIAALQEGGIISTALPTESPIRILIGGQDRFLGTAGRVGQKLAVQVVEPVTDQTDLRARSTRASAQFNPTLGAPNAQATQASAQQHPDSQY